MSENIALLKQSNDWNNKEFTLMENLEKEKESQE